MRAVFAAVLLAGLIGVPQASGQVSPVPGWQLDCGMVYSRPYDPIVAPGGTSHLHDIFGAEITPDTTYPDLRSSPNTCRFPSGENGGDKSGYWVPALYDRSGDKARVGKAVAYYRVAPYVDASKIRPFPTGLKVVAGDHMARGPQTYVGYSCGGGGSGGTAPEDLPKDCQNDNYPKVIASVRFPDCSDGRADSPDHKSHMAYSRLGECPATHPVHVPRFVLEIRYELRRGEGATLANNSRDAYGMHADFFSGWSDTRLEELIRGTMWR